MIYTPVSGLRSDLRRMANRTKDLRAEAATIIEVTSNEQWLWSPDKNRWNMAQIVAHLNSVARLGLPRIEEAVARLRAENLLSDNPPKYGWFERFFIRLLSPNPPFQVPVPSVYVPIASDDPTGQTGPEFLELLTRTLTCIESANGLDLIRQKVPSPANEKLRLTVGAWLEGMVGHNEYHWIQVRALRDQAGFPRNGALT
jgi:hypothetical protein